MYALVKYLSDKQKDVVPISHIADWEPADPNHNPTKVFSVFWSPDEKESLQDFLAEAQGNPRKLIPLDIMLDQSDNGTSLAALSGYYNAYVLKVGDVKETLQKTIGVRKKSDKKATSRSTDDMPTSAKHTTNTVPVGLPVPLVVNQDSKKKQLAKEKKAQTNIVSVSQHSTGDASEEETSVNDGVVDICTFATRAKKSVKKATSRPTDDVPTSAKHTTNTVPGLPVPLVVNQNSKKKQLAKEKKAQTNIVSVSQHSAGDEFLKARKSLFRNIQITEKMDLTSEEETSGDDGVVPQRMYDELRKKYTQLKDKLASKTREAERLLNCNLNLQDMYFKLKKENRPKEPSKSATGTTLIKNVPNEFDKLFLKSSPTATSTPPRVDPPEGAITSPTFLESPESIPTTSMQNSVCPMSIADADTAVASGIEMKDATVHMGEGVYVPLPSYVMACKVKKGTAGDSLFVKNHAALIWGQQDLMNRSVTGKRCYAIKGSAPKKSLTPQKLQIIHDQFAKRMRSEPDFNPENEAKRKAQVNTFISDKIMTLNRAQSKDKRNPDQLPAKD